MDRKVKNTLLLFGLFVLISVAGGIFAYIFQENSIAEKQKVLLNIKQTALDTRQLQKQLEVYRMRAGEIDSLLNLRKYNIPESLEQADFFDFVTNISGYFSLHSFVNMKFEKIVAEQYYNYYHFKLSGTSTFNDLYKLLYAIEFSKELKKITSFETSNFLKVDDDGVPYFLTNFSMDVYVYFADNNRFTVVNTRENDLRASYLYDVFYPLIRNEIPPNTDGLLDVQTAELLALIPDGAYLSDHSGNTFLLWEGDRVYLGYLTQINFKENSVKFILNKGGIIETTELGLDNRDSGKRR
ncbi:MAG: hypothetical protein SCALA702_18740 [Melioribacteraceae bacterium]|nr:MAG: hypothetical protein SCALA702_18740 [Melioribacteraceae bacterium]